MKTLEEEAWASPAVLILAPLAIGITLLAWMGTALGLAEVPGDKPYNSDPRKRRGPAYGCGCNTCCFGSPPADQEARKCSRCGTTLY